MKGDLNKQFDLLEKIFSFRRKRWSQGRIAPGLAVSSSPLPVYLSALPASAVPSDSSIRCTSSALHTSSVAFSATPVFFSDSAFYAAPSMAWVPFPFLALLAGSVFVSCFLATSLGSAFFSPLCRLALGFPLVALGLFLDPLSLTAALGTTNAMHDPAGSSCNRGNTRQGAEMGEGACPSDGKGRQSQ